MVIGIIALLTGKTAEIITISVFGALNIIYYFDDCTAAIKKKRTRIGTTF